MQRTRVDVFEGIFLIFLGLGTLVGIIVISYTLYNAYKYRDDGDHGEGEDLPVVGELPTGGKGGRKLFLSFGLSAIIVLGLVFWSYQMLLYVEAGPGNDEPGEDAVEIDVEGEAFSWSFHYENGAESTGELVVPEDTPIWLSVTSTDVWHAFGIPDQRVKADAIPGEYSETWFMADELGDGDGESVTHEDAIECFELCGEGHSNMKADLTVMEQGAYEEWLAEQGSDGGNETGANESGADGAEGNESEANGSDGAGADNETGANEGGADNATDANGGNDTGVDDGTNESEDNATDGNGDDAGEGGES